MLCRFCFSKNMVRPQIEAFCGIAREVIETDIREWPRGPTASFGHLQRLMLSCSVERQPWRTALFDPVQATYAVDFMLSTYYAHFQLYKHCLSSVPVLDSEQQNVAGIESLRLSSPLADAILVQPLPPQVLPAAAAAPAAVAAAAEHHSGAS